MCLVTLKCVFGLKIFFLSAAEKVNFQRPYLLSRWKLPTGLL